MDDRSEPGLLEKERPKEASILQLPLAMDQEARSEFIDVAAHELRGLLTIIYTGTHLLRTGLGLDEASRDEILGDMEQATDKLQRDLDGLTMLARLGLAAVQPGTVKLQDMVPRLVAKFKELRRHREVQARVEGELPELTAVPAYVDLSLRNVLAAVDEAALPEGSLEVQAIAAIGEVGLSVSGPVEPGLTARLVAEAFSGEETPAGQRRRISPIITRLLIASQGGRVWAVLHEEGRLDVNMALPLIAVAGATS